jgi:hypothetical protein
MNCSRDLAQEPSVARSGFAVGARGPCTVQRALDHTALPGRVRGQVIRPIAGTWPARIRASMTA